MLCVVLPGTGSMRERHSTAQQLSCVVPVSPVCSLSWGFSAAVCCVLCIALPTHHPPTHHAPTSRGS